MFDINNVDKEQTRNGVWTEFNSGSFLIAHTSSLAFQREFSRLQQPYLKKIERGTIDPEVSTSILCKAMAKGLLLDWKDVGSGNKKLPYTVEMAAKVLESNQDLREFVMEYSTNLENFRSEEMLEEGES